MASTKSCTDDIDSSSTPETDTSAPQPVPRDDFLNIAPWRNQSAMEEGWRNQAMIEDAGRVLFYMGDDDAHKLSATQELAGVDDIGDRKIVVGICAMSKKSGSKPMLEILARLERFEYLQIIVFEEETILDSSVEDWPICDVFISFFSAGFPLAKAIEYKNLRKPFVINDLEAQYLLMDRREVYKILVREGIAHPRYAVMNRGLDGEPVEVFEENEDAVEINGIVFQRPFVEKPVCADDHNVYIYFPVSAGGGCQRLFRKVGSRSSVYSPCSRVRKTGSYIYEDFMPTDGTDVKVYTVGPDYAHAEARKSPALDGKVERDKDGKEIRYPVVLSVGEKLLARKVCLAFQQNVCGFDLLRTSGKSYVCDVNGFSFVKNSTKYYDDCANVLGTMIVRALAPQLHIPLVLGAAPEDIPVVPTTSGSMMELRCVVAVIRHGDRTPKQKMKMEVKHKKFFTLFEKYDGYKKGHLKLKKPKQLQEVLDIARDLLQERNLDSNPEVQEKKAKLRQLKLVLEMYGHFSGINRKVQLKYQPNGAPKRSSSEEDEVPREPSLVLIVKWGGELTPAGKYQAEDLGKAFRTLYPGGRGEFETPGLGFLRLHSTFRHDLKIYASDEGRVQMTAAAFTKGLLALEGELTPILVAMVKSANTNGLLDKEGETSKYRHIVKEKLLELLNQDKEFDNEDIQKLVPTGGVSLMNAVKFIKNPKKLCDQIFQMLQEIVARIKTLKMKLKSRDLKLYHNESWELLIRRWAKLEKDFKLKTGMYDISKIPDIYDCIKYELQHNQKTLQFTRAEELFRCSKAMADIVIPQEYGITVEEKLHISQSICTPLMRKIHNDLLQCCQGMDSPNPDDEEYTRLNVKYTKGVSTPERFVRTRLYFTSESHIHSLLNMFHYGGLCDDVTDEQWKKAMDFLGNTPELNYMTQINIMMFEDPTKDWQSPEKFHVELHFSPGAYTSFEKNVMGNSGSGYRPTLSRLGGAGSMPDFLAGKSTLEPSVPTNIITEETKAAALSKSIKEEPLTEENEMTSSGSPSVENMDNNIVEKSAEDGENVTDKSIKDDGNLTKSIDDGENMTDKSNDGGNMTGKSIKDSEPSDVGKLDLENSAEVAVDKSVDELGIHVDKLSVIDKSTVTTGMPIEMADSSLDGKSGVVAGKPDFSPDNNAADMTKLISTDVTGNVSPAVDIPDSNIGDSSPMNDTDDGDLSRTPTIHSTDIDMGASDVADNDALDGNKGNTDEGNSENSDKGKIEHKGNAKPADVGNTEDVGNSEIKNTEDVGNSEIKNTKDTGNTGNIASSNIKNIGEGKRERKKFFVNLAVNPVVDFSSSESNKPQKSQQSLGIRDDVSGNEINKDGGSTAIDQLDFADVFDLGEADIGDLGDITDSSDSDAQESTTLTSVQGLQGKTSSSGGNVPQPKSPDPLIPEWDWDDGHDNKPTNVEDKTDTIQSESRSLAQRQRSVSLSDPNFSTSLQLAPDSPSAVSLPKPIEDCRRNSFGEEKRSRSLEDQEPRSGIALIEKHYLTIHLPINKDCHLNAFSNLIYFNPDAFKDPSLVTLGASPSPHGQPMTPRCPNLAGSCSTPNLFGSESAGHDLHFAFDGFNMVPSLKPLETLHNALTMQDMDDFLTRATTTKFFTPASSPMYGSTTGVVSPIYQEQVVRVKSTQSLPSSCNSSGGPSSPTSASTPVDFMNKLKKYILDSQKRMQENDGDVDPNTANQQSTQSTQSTNQQQPGSSNQNAQTSTNKNSSSYPVVKLSNQKGASLVSRSNPANKQSPAVTSPLIGQKQNGGSKQQVNSKNSSTTQQDIEQDGNNKQQTSIKNTATTQDVKTNSNKLSTNLDKGGNPAQTSVSRSVARPSNPRSPVFHVTHVPEESLLKNVTTPQDMTTTSTVTKNVTTPQDMTTTSTVTEQKATTSTLHDTSKVLSNDKGN